MKYLKLIAVNITSFIFGAQCIMLNTLQTLNPANPAISVIGTSALICLVIWLQACLSLMKDLK